MDTSLVRLVIDLLAEKYNWTYEECLNRFYRSKTCVSLSDRETGGFTFSPIEIVERFDGEITGVYYVNR